MRKVVVDTNVDVSALNFGGLPEAALDLARSGIVLLYFSPQILAELDGMLREKFAWSRPKARAALAAIRSFAIEVLPEEAVREIKEDPEDDRILECAVAAEADCIVSGDRHLRDFGAFRGMPILSPREFLEQFG